MEVTLAFYTIRLKLFCNSGSREALKELDKRWTSKLRREWKTLVVEAINDTDLRGKLDTILWTDCQDPTLVEAKITDTVADAVESVTFTSASSWTQGEDGLHEGSLEILLKKSTSPPGGWTYTAGGVQISVYVHYAWEEGVKRA